MRWLLRGCQLAVVFMLSGGLSWAQSQTKLDLSTLDYQLKARELAPDVFVVEGANADFSPANGCNIINTGFIVTGAGVVVINTGPSSLYGQQLRDLIARTSAQPVVKVIHLNLHPDYFLGNQAFADVPRAATVTTRAGMKREAGGYADNMYRLCGEWMKGTEALLPSTDLNVGVERIGNHELETLELSGHTDSDVVLIDRPSGVMFAGGLVFAQRVPTTPHAQVSAWLSSLQTLSKTSHTALVPSHGVVALSTQGIALTQRYMSWLDTAFRDAAERGLEMNEVLRMPVPPEFKTWAGFDTEYTRNVANLYPRYERAVLVGTPAKLP